MKYLAIVLMSVFALSANAQEKKKNKNAKHEVEVNGICGMCEKRIEKASYAVKGVKMAKWDAESKKLNLILDERKTSLLDVEKAVAEVGHDTKNIKATDESYANLHGCCKYERE